MHAKRKNKGVIVASLTVLAVLIFAWWSWQSVPGYNIVPGYITVENAYLNHQSGVMVEVSGHVVRLLTDDKDDQQHQKFVIRLGNGQTLLVTHNIVSSKTVPLGIGHEVTVRGEYTWTEPGGIIHWTHRDYSLERRHGWIEHQGQKYD